MTVLIVLGIIFLFFALLLSARLKVFVRLTNEVHLRAGLGLIVLTLAPKKKRKSVDPDDFTYEKYQKRLAKEKRLAEKKEAKKRRKAEKKQKQLAKEASAAATIAKTAGDADDESDENKLATILALIEFALNELPQLASSIHTEVKLLHITVGGEEADKIARQYGVLSGTVALLLELLDNKTDMKKLKPGAVIVEADFLLAKTKTELDLSFKLSLFAIVRTGWHTLLWFIGQKLHKVR